MTEPGDHVHRRVAEYAREVLAAGDVVEWRPDHAIRLFDAGDDMAGAATELVDELVAASRIARGGDGTGGSPARVGLGRLGAGGKRQQQDRGKNRRGAGECSGQIRHSWITNREKVLARMATLKAAELNMPKVTRKRVRPSPTSSRLPERC